jgi:hypothetical protein
VAVRFPAMRAFMVVVHAMAMPHFLFVAECGAQASRA